MNRIPKTVLAGGVALLSLVATAACARAAEDHGKMDHGKGDHGKADQGKTDKSPKKEAPKGGKLSQTIDMKVTDKGFEPAAVTVRKGEPVTLIITRTTERTCATDIVIDEAGVKAKLPLNQAVNVTFTPNSSGELKYGCAMNKMVGGVLSVR